MFKIHLDYFMKFGSVRKKKFLMEYFKWSYRANPVTAEDVFRFYQYTPEKLIQELIDKNEIYKLYL